MEENAYRILLYCKYKICLVMTRQIAKWEWKKMPKEYYYKYKIYV